MNITLSNYKGT